MADIIVLNEITELLNNVNSELSTDISSVKSVVDTISTNVNTANANINAIKTNTAANNTASATGTLSQKMTYIINNVNRVYVTGNSLVKTISSSTQTISFESKLPTANSSSVYSYGTKYNYYVNYDGEYKFSITCAISDIAYISSGSKSYNVSCGLQVNVTRGRSQETNTYSTALSTTGLSDVASTTKTMNIVLSRGDRIQCCMYASGVGENTNCSSIYTKSFTATCTNMAIYGTSKTLSSNDVFV